VEPGSAVDHEIISVFIILGRTHARPHGRGGHAVHTNEGAPWATFAAVFGTRERAAA
jgi:hypothetical protein